MKQNIINRLHETIRIRWIPIYKGKCSEGRVPGCSLCARLGCRGCPICEKYKNSCLDAVKFGYREWLGSDHRWQKHDPAALKILQNLIKLLPVKERNKQEIKYLEK